MGGRTMVRGVLTIIWKSLSLQVTAVPLLIALLPAALSAETIVFRNDTTMSLVIQGAYVVRGQVRADQPIPMAAGATARITLPGSKLITIYQSKAPNRPVFQGTIPGGSEDLSFSIVPDPMTGKVKMEKKHSPSAH